MSALTPRRGQRDADAGADLDQMIVDLVALAQPVDDAPREVGGVLGGVDVLLEHDEFVAAEARDEILRAQHLAQPVGDRAQQLVAAGMAERIVDLLELVEVDEQQRGQVLGIVLDASSRSISSRKLTPVRKRGQFVEARQMADLGFGVAPLGDVFEQHDGAAAGHRLESPGQRPVAAMSGSAVMISRACELSISATISLPLAAEIEPALTQAATMSRALAPRCTRSSGKLHHLAEAVVHDRQPSVGARTCTGRAACCSAPCRTGRRARLRARSTQRLHEDGCRLRLIPA